jgi:predicted transcriptional regulator
MTVLELKNRIGLSAAALPDAEREVSGVYIGDLLSWVMGRARSADAWITIMSNKNIAAVAALTDCACIILAEGVSPDDGVAQLAEQKGINLLLSEKSAYETALDISKCL